MNFFQFEDPPDRLLAEVVEEFVAVMLGATTAAFIFSCLGRIVRFWFDISYYNFDVLYDTTMIRQVQDVILGIVTLVAIGLLPAIWVIVWFIHDCWSSETYP